MHTLRYVSTSVCGRMKNSASTLNTLEISFKYVMNTLQYVGIRCHTARGSRNFVHAYTLDIILMYATCKIRIR